MLRDQTENTIDRDTFVQENTDTKNVTNQIREIRYLSFNEESSLRGREQFFGLASL